MARAIHLASRTLSWLAAAILIAIALATSVDAIFRLLTGRPIAGVIEYSEVALVALAFLGLAGAHLRGEHVSTDVVLRRAPKRLKRYITAMGLGVAIIGITVLTMATGLVAWDSVNTGEYRFGAVPVPLWPARISITLGLIALLAETIIEFLSLMRGDDSGDHGPNVEAAALI